MKYASNIKGQTWAEGLYINPFAQVCPKKSNQPLFFHKQPFLNISANITQILPDIYKTIRAIWPNFSCSSDNLKSARICSYSFHCLFVKFISTSAILVVVFWGLCVNSAYSHSQSMSILWCSSANKDSTLLSESVWEKHSQPNATNNKDSPIISNFFAIFLIFLLPCRNTAGEGFAFIHLIP